MEGGVLTTHNVVLCTSGCTAGRKVRYRNGKGNKNEGYLTL